MSKSSNNDYVPEGWTRAPISECVEVNPSKSMPPSNFDSVISFIPMALVEAGTGRLDATTGKPFSSVTGSYRHFLEGDILFAKITPCMENGKAALACNLQSGYGIGSTEFIVLRPTENIAPKYVLHFLLQSSLRTRARATMKGTAGQLRVSPGFFDEEILPLPPLAEQRRIVEEIEKQFTRLDAAVAALKRIRANLKRYRASVLKAACEGKLVPTEAELAAKERRTYEPASELLKRILTDRRKHWEDSQKTATRKKQYVEPEAPDTSGLPTLPEGWTWCTVDVCAEVQGGVQKQPKRRPQDNAYPFLRVANVARNHLDLSDVHQIELFGDELEKLRLIEGDILVVEGNGSPSEIGRAAIWDGSIEDCVHQNHLIRIRCADNVLPKWFNAYWNSPFGSKSIQALASSTSGLHTLSVSKIKSLHLPLPPSKEQSRIISGVESSLSTIDAQLTLTDANLKRAERLRQAILKRAFEGKLVPTEAEIAAREGRTYEPASALLARIKAEREDQSQSISKRQKRRVEKSMQGVPHD